MPPSPHSKSTGDRDNSPYGPSWYDVYIIMQELSGNFPDEGIVVRLHSNRSVNNKAGLRVDILNRVGTILGSCRFLDNGPQSAKTAAAAFWRAATRAYHLLENAKEEGLTIVTQLDITVPEGDPPSSPDATCD